MDADENTRELLRTYAERAAPSAEKRERAWAAITAAAGAAPVRGAAPANVALKATLGIGVVLAVGIASWTRFHDDALVVPEAATITAEAPRDEARADDERRAAAQEEEVSAPSIAAPRDLAAPETTRPAPHRDDLAAPAPDQARDAIEPDTTESPSTLAAELALMDAARAALARGDVPATLAALDAHEARFPTGTLASERDVVRITALCEAGRTAEASVAAAAAGSRPAITRALSRCGTP